MSAIMYRDRIYGLGGAGGGGGGGTAAQELTAAEYAELTQAEKTNGTIYFVKGVHNGDTFVDSNQGTNWKACTVDADATRLACVVTLNNILYAGFYFDISTKISTLIPDSTLREIATSLGKTFQPCTTLTITQSDTQPKLYWAYSSSHDDLYLDVTNIASQSVSIKCGYSGCVNNLYESEDMSNKVYFMDTLYAEHD